MTKAEEIYHRFVQYEWNEIGEGMKKSILDAINEALSQPSVSGSLLTPRQVDDKFTKEWAEPRVGEYEYCSTAQVLAWGYREGYNEARKDLSNYR